MRSLCADLVRQRNDVGGNSFWAIAFSHTNERNGEMSEAADAHGLTMHERAREGGREGAIARSAGV